MLVALFWSLHAGAAIPERVVSLNLCTDQMLVLLAPEKVLALSPLARDPALSFVAARGGTPSRSCELRPRRCCACTRT